MNDFLTSRFSHSYAKIYNGMLQHNGAQFISKYIKDESKTTPDKFIELYATERPTDRVYDALKEVYDVQQAGYVQLLEHLKKEPVSLQLRDVMAVILKVDENERWKEMFNAKGTQFDLLLAIPSLSRIVSVSTSKIKSMKQNTLKPFDILNIKMYGFYEHFNKLHGTSHRSVTMTKQTAIERMNTFDSLKFALRTIKDAKRLAKCANMRLHSSFSGNEYELGFYFLCICKISSFESFSDLYTPSNSMKFLINDESSNMHAIMDPQALSLSNQLLDVPVGIGACTSGIADRRLNKFGDFVDIGGYFLLSCRWPMGHTIPKIICALPLGGKLSHETLYVEALMNTRRKLEYERLNLLIGSDTMDILKKSANLTIDRSSKWVYYKDSKWDADAFSFLVSREFKKPKFSEILKSGLAQTTIKECHRLVHLYLKHHEHVKNLYITDDPKTELSIAYPPIIHDANVGDQG
ncbi:MAG: hypothetical protein K8823_488 [Cenarchaeum symbiont of Oopsacas minuta]|nr:hypothetical protein [Cenarchaeum symbiont of Oopsacas minuta]